MPYIPCMYAYAVPWAPLWPLRCTRCMLGYCVAVMDSAQGVWSGGGAALAAGPLSQSAWSGGCFSPQMAAASARLNAGHNTGAATDTVTSEVAAAADLAAHWVGDYRGDRQNTSKHLRRSMVVVRTEAVRSRKLSHHGA